MIKINDFKVLPSGLLVSPDGYVYPFASLRSALLAALCVLNGSISLSKFLSL